MVIMPLYGHVYLISICKLSIICINSESRHVIVTILYLLFGVHSQKLLVDKTKKAMVREVSCNLLVGRSLNIGLPLDYAIQSATKEGVM